MNVESSKLWAAEVAERVLRGEIADLQARLDDICEANRHEIICIVLKEIRARYDSSHHSPDVIAKNAATAKAYANAVYPEAK